MAQILNTYGKNFPKGTTQLQIELWGFRADHKKENGGLGAYGHCRNAMNLIWPNLNWHDWMSRRMLALNTYKTNAWTGCAAAGKTFDAGLFGITFWLADPNNTSVIFTSTTGKMVRKRIWPVIQHLYANYPDCPGNLVDSKTTLQAKKGDDKHGIFALAVREGPTQKAVADIQGLHAERILIVIDEGTDTPEAILEAIPNLRKGCKDFRLIIIGNAASKLDPHGRISEPEDGWANVTVEDEEWLTKGVPDWEIDPGICLHFDGLKSPNVLLGQDRWPFLFTCTDLERARKSPHAEETLGFWKFTRGFWAPEGLCDTVMSEPMIERYKGMDKFTFLSHATNIAALDPGFGGDDCVLRKGRMGNLEDGRIAIQLVSTHKLVIRPTKDDPAENQIVRQTQALCQGEHVSLSERVEPKNLGVDSTFRGGTLAMTFVREWSAEIICIECGGVPTDSIISEEDTTSTNGKKIIRTARDVYDRYITELWFNVKEFLVHGLLRGLEVEDSRQFCRRQYEQKGRPIKTYLETKKEYKAKNGSQSPNEADADAILVAVAKRRGAVASGGTASDASRDWLAIARKMDDINVIDEDEESSQRESEDVFALQDI